MIYNMDCLDYLRKSPSGVYDLVIADPPYYRIWGEFDFVWKSQDEYLSWCRDWITECHRVLKPGGAMYIWGKVGFGNGYSLFKLADWCESSGLFVVRNWITQRNVRGRGTKRGFVEAREELLFMTKGDGYKWNVAYTEERTNRKDLGFDGKPRKSEFKRVTDVWVDITEASQSRRERFVLPDGTNFPTVKSLKLCERIIRASTDEHDRVFIPFGGSGSEAVACVGLNRPFDLTEVNSVYFDHVIVPRLRSVGVLHAP